MLITPSHDLSICFCLHLWYCFLSIFIQRESSLYKEQGLMLTHILSLGAIVNNNKCASVYRTRGRGHKKIDRVGVFWSAPRGELMRQQGSSYCSYFFTYLINAPWSKITDNIWGGREGYDVIMTPWTPPNGRPATKLWARTLGKKEKTRFFKILAPLNLLFAVTLVWDVNLFLNLFG